MASNEVYVLLAKINDDIVILKNGDSYDIEYDIEKYKESLYDDKVSLKAARVSEEDYEDCVNGNRNKLIEIFNA